MTRSEQRLQLLLFRLGQTRFGVLACQIETLRGHDGTGSARWFHALLGFPESPSYRAPTEALVSRGELSSTWIILDAMEELLDIPLEAIKPFPELVEPFSLRRGLWGILLDNEQLVFIVDLQQMLKLDDISAMNAGEIANLN